MTNGMGTQGPGGAFRGQKKRWVLAPVPAPRIVEGLGAYPPTIQRLLAGRGITNATAAEFYLAADRRSLASPALLPDMDIAVARLYRALLRGEKIGVYGDFDVDGVTSTVLLLESLRALGADAVGYIPHRVDEGHGLNRTGLERLVSQGCTVVVTGDCGITGLPDGRHPPKGLDIIITDHHLPGPELPPVIAAVNPNRHDAVYPSPELAGVGVALKLIQGLYESLGKTWDESLLELVALGTVADVAPLVGENRYLVRAGLQVLRASRRPGIQALARKAGLDLATATEESIGFALGPRLNAAGRVAHADVSLKLLLTRDEAEAESLASELNRMNDQRRAMTQKVVDKAREDVFALPSLEPLLMVGGNDFPPGIVGLAAGRLAQEFYRPALVYQQDRVSIRGSARSIPEFDVTDALTRCRALLSRFGGHHQAAGFSAPIAHLEPLRNQLIALAGELLDGVDLRPTIHLDAEIAPSAVPGPVMKMLQQMAPFGSGNPPPAFLGSRVEVLSARPVGDGSHLRLKLRDEKAVWDGIAFGLGERAAEARGLVDIAYALRASNGNGRRGERASLEIEVFDFRPAVR